MSSFVADTDPQIAEIINQEAQRQESGLELIASENSVGRSVMEVQGSVLTNKYALPFEIRSPFVTSGVRIGTPAITTTGIKPEQAGLIAQLISNLLKNPCSEQTIKDCRNQVEELCKAFPLYR